MKRLKKLLAAGVSLAMVLSLFAGCAGNKPGGENNNPPSPPPSQQGDSQQGGQTVPEGGTVKVGVLLPMSGATAYYGGVQYDGIEFCASYINQNGGIKSMDGKQIELVLQDSASDPETGVSAFEYLIEQGVSAVIGPYNSTVAAATTPLAIQHGIPYVITNATAENFMGTANKYVYRTNVGSTDGDKMWEIVLDYLSTVRPDNPTDKVAVVYDEGDWGSAAVTSWRNNASDLGYEVVVDEAVSESTTDMSVLVNKIKSADCDLVILATFSAATNLLVKQMADYQCDAKMIGLGGGVGDLEFIENAGAAAENVLYCAPWVPSYGGAAPEAEALAADFEAKYGYALTMEPCWGWLGMATIINAIEAAGSADREAIAGALYSMDVDGSDWALWFSGYEGVNFCTEGQTSPGYGSDSGERYNQNIALGDMGGMVMVQVQNGAWTIVYPTSYTGGADIIVY